MTKEKTNRIYIIISIILTCSVMIIFINQKWGWHEDEIFSYGSSNYKYDNLFQTFGDLDSLNYLYFSKIKDKNILLTLKNIKYYYNHKDEFQNMLKEKELEQKPVWKTSNDALEYVTISKNDIFNYKMVLYNQVRDVHPPLFYILVHFVSSFFLNTFSKYIIFLINISFYLAICWIFVKLMKLLNKEKYTSGVILFYGLSMGAISIVMFQRMYVMLSFFVLLYFYLHLKIIKNDYNISSTISKKMFVTIILGFLTHYYFCFYALLLFLTMIINIIKNNKISVLKTYFLIHVKSAIIGVLLFPASIYHIFFSYRGLGMEKITTSYFHRLKEYLELLFYSFSFPRILGYIILIFILLYLINKRRKFKNSDLIRILFVPIILYFFFIIKITPYINIRYISLIFPILVLGMVLILSDFLKKLENKFLKYLVVFLIFLFPIYGFWKSKPQFLYSNYKNRIELSQKFKDVKLIYIGEYDFVYLKDMEEFLRYKNFLILKSSELEFLENNLGLKNDNEFILNIKSEVPNKEEVLNRVISLTGFKTSVLLLDDGLSKIYKITNY